MKRQLCFLVTLLIIHQPSIGQIQMNLQSYVETGSNRLTDEQSLRLAFFTGADMNVSKHLEKLNIRMATRLNYTPYDQRSFGGIRLDGKLPYKFKKTTFSLHSYYIFSPVSQLMNETNIGVYGGFRRKRIEFYTGTSFRTYKFTKAAREEFAIPSEAAIKRENFILNYFGSVYAMPNDDLWNINLTLTNMDFFSISHSANPYIYLQGQYKHKQLKMYIQAWYLSAGAFNLHINHFGYFLRAGVIWER